MSAKERDRLKVLHEVNKRHITQKQAAAELGLSVRRVRQMLVRLRTRGDGALRHGLSGRPSNRKTPEAVKRRAVELYLLPQLSIDEKSHCAQNPTLAGVLIAAESDC